MHACFKLPGVVVVAALFDLSLLAVMGGAASPGRMANDYPIAPTPATSVEFNDTFWGPRIDTNRRVTIPYCFGKCEEFGRMENFRAAAGEPDARWTGRFGFNDSDVSKVIEGASACLMTQPDADLEKYLDELIVLFQEAQESDGYLYTLWTAGDNAPPHDKVICSSGREDRWGRIYTAHQLYNLGHMYEAAVAHYQATGKKTYLDVCLRSTELLLKTFGDGKLELPPGHQEIELGLVKLYRVTGDQRLLDLAKYFLDLRGKVTTSREKNWGPYNQDHEPVTEQDAAVGHAVRAGYMYAAMTDVAVLAGDQSYREAVDRIWDDIVRRKLHVTGGAGARHEGEAFGEAYELPNLTAYNETCAAIAQCYFNHRMFLLHGKAKYIDVLERVLYNGALSGVSYDGNRFFYPNPLASDGSHQRSEWFDCSCCPTNVCRFIPSVPGYAYAVRERDVYVNLFVAGTAEVDVQGEAVTVTQATNYPWDGVVEISVKAPKDIGPVRLRVRIPGWARGEVLPGRLYWFSDEQANEAASSIGDGPESLVEDAIDKDGYLTIDRDWTDGAVLKLRLPMPVRRVLADERVKEDRGRVALQRGPLVYCVEHPEFSDGKVSKVWVAEDAAISTSENSELCGGVTTLVWKNPGDDRQYTAIPYYSWAHRGPGEMAVWLPASQPTD